MWTIIKSCPTLGTTMFLQVIPHSSGQIGQIHGQTRKSVQTCPTLDTTGFYNTKLDKLDKLDKILTRNIK